METTLLVLGLMLVGMILIAAEVIVIPGFGFVGIAGAAVLFYAIWYSFREQGAPVAITLGGVSLLASTAILLYAPRSRIGKKLTLTATITERSGYDRPAREAGVAVGQTAAVVSDLKPSGVAMFGEHRIEVRTESEWIERGTQVRVVELKSGQVWVEPVTDSEQLPAAEDPGGEPNAPIAPDAGPDANTDAPETDLPEPQTAQNESEPNDA